ncbi:MAG: hypothetical protein GXP42_11660 [Chloroflexi bacterium]|nr:hypothetical protein [Chloroflexota bacterium]
MFQGLVVDESGRPVDVAWVGADACYVVEEDGFRRHIDAEQVDRAVLRWLKEQIIANREMAVRGTLELMGKDDIFTKTALEFAIDHLDERVDEPLPIELVELLRSFGFQVVLDFHGDVVAIRAASMEEED